MSSSGFDPFRASRALHWHNRVASWRAQPAQSIVHGLALLVLVALLLPWLWHGVQSMAPALREALIRWPVPLALAWLGVIASVQAQGLHRLEQTSARDWLAALPIEARCHARRRRDRLWQGVIVSALGGAILLLAMNSPPQVQIAHLTCVAVATALAPGLVRLRRRAWVRARDGSVLNDAGAGRFWRWQWLACGTALRGRTLAAGLWALLLVPMGTAAAGVLAIALTGLGVAVLLTAWQRSLAVLIQAHAWLGAEPLSGTALLRGCVALPLLQLGAGTTLVAGVFVALGTPGIAAFAALAVTMLGGLQLMIHAAWRAQPRQIALRFALNLVVLLALLQTVPPLVLPVWAVQMGVMWRRIART